MIRPTREHRIALCVAAVIAALALAMYHPGEPRPFDTLDFSEFLPFLTGNDTFLGRFSAISRYYVVQHARLNVLSYVALAAKWSILGPHPVIWQWARVAEMAAIIVGAYLFFRRLAVGPVAAAIAASLFVTARVAGEGWTRMTMGEPLGLLAALGALLVATHWREARRPLLLAACSGLLMALAVLAKEMLIGMLPLLWLVGLARGSDGLLGRPTLGRPELHRLFWCTLPPLAAFTAALIVALGGGAGGFTTLYGQSVPGIAELGRLIARPWLVQGARPAFDLLLLPGNALALLLLIAGSAAAWRSDSTRRHLGWASVGALAICVAFAVLYLPWPYFNLYYALPFLLGPALVLAIGVQALLQRGRAAQAAVWLGTLGMTVGTAAGTAHAAGFAIGLQQVNGELTQDLGQIPSADRIVVTRRVLAPTAWSGTAPTLRSYALATGAARTLPPGQDVTCADGDRLMLGGIGRTVMITYLHGCGGLQQPSARIVRRYRYLRVGWTGVGIAGDSVEADLLVSPAAMAAAGDSSKIRSSRAPRTD